MTGGSANSFSRREFLTAVAGAVVVTGAGSAVFASTRHAVAHPAPGAEVATSRVAGPLVPTRAASAGTTAVPTSADVPTPSRQPGHPAPGPGTAEVVAAPGPTAAPGRSAFTSGVHVVDSLPAGPARLAITVDDGDDSAVVGAFLQFARDSGVRLTFFPNGIYRAWTDHRVTLAALVGSGQVQLGDHTWSHPKLPTLSDAAIAGEIRRNEDFLRTTFGVDPRPYLRPPYGLHDARTDAVAASLGYHAVTTWNGVFDDSSAHLTASRIVSNAKACFTAGRIVLGHANHPPVTTVYGQLLDIIRSRHLQTVTLADVFGG